MRKPRSGANDRRSLRIESDLFIYAARMPDGGFQIQGHDLAGNPFSGDPDSDYEYTVTIARKDLRKIVKALHGRPWHDALDLFEANYPMIAQAGETKWLKSIGVPFEFWSWP